LTRDSPSARTCWLTFAGSGAGNGECWLAK
jgi:hypothetical protein